MVLKTRSREIRLRSKELRIRTAESPGALELEEGKPLDNDAILDRFEAEASAALDKGSALGRIDSAGLLREMSLQTQVHL